MIRYRLGQAYEERTWGRPGQRPWLAQADISGGNWWSQYEEAAPSREPPPFEPEEPYRYNQPAAYQVYAMAPWPDWSESGAGNWLPPPPAEVRYAPSEPVQVASSGNGAGADWWNWQPFFPSSPESAGALSQGPFDMLLASVQADVGSLLQARQRLLTWQASAPAEVQPTIQSLLGDQANLEAQLPAANQAVAVISGGDILGSIPAGATVGTFLTQMEMHLARVNALAAKLGQAGLATAQSAISWGPVIGIVLGGIGVLWLLGRGRRRR